jgi:sugar transferase (PEP-CTERM/EpsH1 system associated)
LKILFIVPYVPNLIRVRPYNLIRNLAARGNRVTVLTVWTGDQDRQDLEALRLQSDRVEAIHVPTWRSLLNCLSALPSRVPLQSVYSWDPALLSKTGDLGRLDNSNTAFDVVHVEHLRGARYGLELRAKTGASRLQIPVVWDSVDSISLLFRKAKVQGKSFLSRGITRLELGRTEKYEAWLVDQFERVLVTSQTDRQALLALANKEAECDQVQVLPNGVDLEYFKPADEENREPETLVISGKMSYHANVAMSLHFLQDIMPIVWSRRPGVKVKIVGKDPPPQIQALAQNPNVDVTGTVPDIRPYLQAATLAVAPVAYGVGIQNKVLEAMACGTAVVTSRQAASALSAEPGRELLTAEDPQEFAGEVLSLIKNASRRQQIGRAGRQYVERCHNWAEITAGLEMIYAQAEGRLRQAAKA